GDEYAGEHVAAHVAEPLLAQRIDCRHWRLLPRRERRAMMDGPGTTLRATARRGTRTQSTGALGRGHRIGVHGRGGSLGEGGRALKRGGRLAAVLALRRRATPCIAAAAVAGEELDQPGHGLEVGPRSE